MKLKHYFDRILSQYSMLEMCMLNLRSLFFLFNTEAVRIDLK